MHLRPRLLGLAASSLALACSSPPTVGFDRGPANFNDPQTTPRDCSTAPAVQFHSMGVNPAPDPGTTCPLPVHDSTLPAVADPGVPFGWIDLGLHSVGDRPTFTVPPGTASITVMEQWVSGGPSSHQIVLSYGGSSGIEDNAAVVGELRDPQNNVVYTDLELKGTADGSGELLYLGSPSAITGTLTFPSSSAGLAALGTAGVAPGPWSLLVNDYAYECWLAVQPPPAVVPPGLLGVTCDAASTVNDGVYRVFVLTKQAGTGGAAAVPDTGSLDVDFHIVDAPTPILGVDSTTAVTDAYMRRMVESYGKLLANAGICLGNVSYYDAPDWARARFATGVSANDAFPCGNFNQLMALSIPGSRTLDIFLVPRLNSTTTGGATVVGIDPTIPGPATVNGTVASGVVVSAEDLRIGPPTTCAPGQGGGLNLLTCGPDIVGYIAAHESGHFLGLYHDSEFFGGLFDPLSDTPHCECGAFCGFSNSQCAAGLSVAACDQHYSTCSGGPNLMFWLLSLTYSKGYLSPQQAQIVRSSPLVSSP